MVGYTTHLYKSSGCCYCCCLAEHPPLQSHKEVLLKTIVGRTVPELIILANEEYSVKKVDEGLLNDVSKLLSKLLKNVWPKIQGLKVLKVHRTFL